MVLSLAPFLSPSEMTTIFGHDLLNDSSQLSGFLDLMSDESKPFECVADVSEAKESMRQLMRSPEWSKHPVVVASHDLCETPSLQQQDELLEWSDTAFEAEIQAFMGDPE